MYRVEVDQPQLLGLQDSELRGRGPGPEQGGQDGCPEGRAPQSCIADVITPVPAIAPVFALVAEVALEVT